jgi:hypothetical protein
MSGIFGLALSTTRAYKMLIIKETQLTDRERKLRFQFPCNLLCMLI